MNTETKQAVEGPLEPTVMQHSPGPWGACNDGKCSCAMVWSTTSDHPVATVTRGAWGDPGCDYGSVSPELARANALLIAAAPTMLAALLDADDALSRCEFAGQGGGVVQASLANIRAVVRKATGAA